MQNSLESITKHRQKVAVALLAIGIILPIGWVVAIFINWPNIVSSHARLGYLFGDWGLVTPLSLFSWYGLSRARSWGPLVFLLFTGAAAFDSLHFGIYLIQEKFLNIPMLVYIIVIIVVLGILAWLSAWEILVLTNKKVGSEADRPAESVA